MKEQLPSTQAKALVKSMELASGTAVQHNILVNAKFGWTLLERRLFLVMLSEINSKYDEEFKLMKIPLKRFIDSKSKNIYSEILKLEERFMARKVSPLSADTLEEIDNINLMSRTKYKKGQGYIEVKFNDDMKPYLLRLVENFTQAQLEELFKLKSEYSERFYWFLKEMQGKKQWSREMTLVELKRKLDIEQNKSYDQYGNFKKRILEVAHKELEESDVPFDYTENKLGKAVYSITLHLRKIIHIHPIASVSSVGDMVSLPPISGVAQSSDGIPAWKMALLDAGVGKKRPESLDVIEGMLTSGEIDVDYIYYVIGVVQKRAKEKPQEVPSPEGLIYTTVKEKYMYEKYIRAKKRKLSNKQSVVQANLFSQAASASSEIMIDEPYMSEEEMMHCYENDRQKIPYYEKHSYEGYCKSKKLEIDGLFKGVKDGKPYWFIRRRKAESA